MSDHTKLFERAAARYEPPGLPMDGLLKRRDRKRRNQRIAAGVVGIAVFVAAVWIVTSGLSFNRSQTPAVPGGMETGPTVAPDTYWDGVGFPPEGMTPSTPEEGKLVAFYDAPLGPSYVFVYADGRVISGDFDGTAREQRLTPDGVELVRSGAIQPEDVNPPSHVPESAWEDPEIKPYVPSRYAVCFYQQSGYEDPSRVLGFFSARARDILRGKDHMYNDPTGDPLECSEVTTDEARALDDILRDVKVVDAKGDQINWEINTLLPHGEWVGTGG